MLNDKMRVEPESHELPVLDRPLLDVSRQQNINNDGILRDGIMNMSLGKIASGVLNSLKPEIFSRRKAAIRTGPTAWLDGLRGCAAFCVCFTHMAGYTHSDLDLCYGYENENAPGEFLTSPVALPFIRLLWSGGHFSVVLFFFISGYVLTKRLIGLLHQGRREEFLESLNSALCRRPGRLFLPVIWTTLLLVFLWHVTGIVTPWPVRQDGLLLELDSWFRDILRFMFPFRQGFLFTYYNPHSWTIQVEFRGSVLVYVWLLSTSQFPSRTRVLLTLLTVLYFVFGINGVWYASFLAGLFTAELDLIAAAESGARTKLPWDGIMKSLKERPRLQKILLHSMLIFGLYLASEPSSDFKNREQVLGTCNGWKTLNWLIPSAYGDEYRWFWLFWGAWLVLVSIKEISWARKLFETGPAQYLGRHSYALYLVHGPLIGLVSERLFYLSGMKEPPDDSQRSMYGEMVNKWGGLSWWPFSNNGPKGLESNFLFCLGVSLIVFLYFAELGTKMLDTPSVKVAKWGYNKLKGN